MLKSLPFHTCRWHVQMQYDAGEVYQWHQHREQQHCSKDGIFQNGNQLLIKFLTEQSTTIPWFSQKLYSQNIYWLFSPLRKYFVFACKAEFDFEGLENQKLETSSGLSRGLSTTVQYTGRVCCAGCSSQYSAFSILVLFS